MAAFQHNPAVQVQFPGTKPGGECINLSWVNGMAQCGIYEDRPDLCRVFPSAPVAIATVPECGYRFLTIEKEVEHGTVSR